MSKNDTKTKTNSSSYSGQTQGSAQTQANANSLWNLGMQNIQNNNGMGYTNQMTAGLTPDQQAAFASIRGGMGAGLGQLNSATGLAGQAGAYTPQQVAAGMSAGAQGVPLGVGQASAGPFAAGGVATAGSLPGVNLGAYMNPYTQSVINSSLDTIGQQQDAATLADKGAQAAHGAFGDARSGVQSALTSQLFDRDRQATIAGLNSGNFTQATGNAEADLNRALGASTATAGNATSAGIANTNAGTQANIASAGNFRGLAGQNAQLAQNNQQFNAQTGLQAAIQNQGAGLQGNAQTLGAASALGNLGMATQQQGLNAANALGAAGQVQQNTQQAGLSAAYQNYLQQQGYTSQQINQLSGIFGQTQAATGMTGSGSSHGTQTTTTPSQLLPSLLKLGLTAGATALGGPVAGAAAGSALSGGNPPPSGSSFG